MDSAVNARIDALVREAKIDTEMATSLMNDSALAYAIVSNLLEMATILWIRDAEVRDIGLDEEERG